MHYRHVKAPVISVWPMSIRTVAVFWRAMQWANSGRFARSRNRENPDRQAARLHIEKRGWKMSPENCLLCIQIAGNERTAE